MGMAGCRVVEVEGARSAARRALLVCRQLKQHKSELTARAGGSLLGQRLLSARVQSPAHLLESDAASREEAVDLARVHLLLGPARRRLEVVVKALGSATVSWSQKLVSGCGQVPGCLDNAEHCESRRAAPWTIAHQSRRSRPARLARPLPSSASPTPTHLDDVAAAGGRLVEVRALERPDRRLEVGLVSAITHCGRQYWCSAHRQGFVCLRRQPRPSTTTEVVEDNRGRRPQHAAGIGRHPHPRSSPTSVVSIARFLRCAASSSASAVA
jgi:hypothetical protein